MSARFRIRTKEGQEISFASQEIFAEFVRSGELAPDDVVYDAETREWSSAQTHPVVLQIRLEAEEQASSTTASRDEPQPPEAPQSDESSPGDIGLDLAPAAAGLTPEQEAAAFVAKMEAERASEQHFEADHLGFKLEKGASSVVEDFALAQPPEPEPPPRTRAPRAEPPRERPARRVTAPPERPRRDAPTAVPAAPKRQDGRGAPRKWVPLAILLVAAVAGGVYFGPAVLAPGSDGSEPSASETPAAPPLPPPEIPSTEEAVRARARERFLTATQAALRGLEQVPDVWLRGQYLAAPSDYPQVRSTFERYLTVVREVRAADEDRYRQAYLRALDDARVVEGGARTLRLSGALTAFQASAARRAQHYDRVEALAEEAIRGHDALAAAEGTIMYQPATGPALSGDPVIEAVGRSADAQTRLNQVLDRLLAHLHGPGGPGEASNVRAWVWAGFLDAMTAS